MDEVEHLHQDQDPRDELVQLREAMVSRPIIEQAKGILIAQQGCTAAEAWLMLRKRSNDERRKIRDVAADLVEQTQKDHRDI